MKVKPFATFACFLILTSAAFAQADAAAGPPAGRGGRGGRGPQLPPVRSNEVQPDRTVIFRVRAAKAATVKLAGDFSHAVQEAQDMTKGEDGVWTITIGPLNPAIYNYSFVVDGVSNIDPVNPMVKRGDLTAESMVEVPAEKPAAYDVQPVPHGSVHLNWYNSTTVGAVRGLYIYTPPGYEQSSARYPVLYLFHGSGDAESGWVDVGRANFILDNLIAAGAAKSMIVVMPYGRPRPEVMLTPTASGRGAANADEEYGKDVLHDVIPYVEKLYRVIANADNRAIAGLSMGGGQALKTGLANLDTFHYLGAFSAAGRGAPEAAYKDFFADPAAANKKLKLFYIACGKTDTLFASAQALSDALDKYEIKHKFAPSEEGHVWRNWRNYLTDFAPQLFR